MAKLLAIACIADGKTHVCRENERRAQGLEWVSSGRIWAGFRVWVDDYCGLGSPLNPALFQQPQVVVGSPQSLERPHPLPETSLITNSCHL
jgi:hypothetical protein